LGFWYRLVVVIAKPLLLATTIRDWRGQENIPADGGVILAANHLTYVDPMSLAHYVLEAGRAPKFLAKNTLFEMPVVRRVFIGAKQIPVYRNTPDAAQALGNAVEAVRDGECLLIYPEGSATRDPDGWPMKARTGVARLALSSGAPVIPIAQWGPQELWAYRTKRIRPFPRKKVRVLAGPPVDLSAYAGRPLDGDVLREVTDLVMGRITDLLVELRDGRPPAVPYDPRAAA
jgi:1-acyl-sn-glycerol-3-phosphate acyltransferase